MERHNAGIQFRRQRQVNVGAAEQLNSVKESSATSTQCMISPSDVKGDMTEEYLNLLGDGRRITISGMYLHLLSPQELKKHCGNVIVGYQPQVIGGKGVDNLEDVGFGAIGKEICGTCKLRYPLCPGHMGHIPLFYGEENSYSPGVELDYSVYHPLFIKDCAMLCRMVCIQCRQILFDPVQMAKVVGELMVDSRSNIRYVYENRASKIDSCPHCNAKQPSYTVDLPTNSIYYSFISKQDSTVPFPFITSRAYAALLTIDKSVPMRSLLGITEYPGTTDRSSVLGMLLLYLPVQPRFMRQPYKSENGCLKDHPLVSKYLAIAKAMSDISRTIGDASKRVNTLKNEVTNKLRELIDLLGATLGSTFPDTVINSLLANYVSDSSNLAISTILGAELLARTSAITDPNERYRVLSAASLNQPVDKSLLYLVWILNPYSNNPEYISNYIASIPFDYKIAYLSLIFVKGIPALEVQSELPPTFSPKVTTLANPQEIDNMLLLGLSERKQLPIPPELKSIYDAMKDMTSSSKEAYLSSLLYQRSQPEASLIFLKSLFELKHGEPDFQTFAAKYIASLSIQRKLAILYLMLYQKLGESNNVPLIRWLTTMYSSSANVFTLYRYVANKYELHRAMGSTAKGKEKNVSEEKVMLAPPLAWLSEVNNNIEVDFIRKEIADRYASIRAAVIDIYTTINKKMPIQAKASWLGVYKHGKKNFFRRYWFNKRTGGSGRAPISPAVDLKFGEYGVPKMLKHQLYRTAIADYGNLNTLNDLLRKKSVTAVERRTVTYTFWEGNSYRRPESGFRIQVGDIVRRHIQDGDYIIVGRNPTIHRLSLRAFTVKIVDTFTGRLRLYMANEYGADFDGDEMNFFVPDSVEAIDEARKLMHVQNCLVSGSTNLPAESPIIDASTGSFLMTLPDRYVTITNLIWIILQVYGVTTNTIDVRDLLERGGKYNRSFLKTKTGTHEEVLTLFSQYEFSSPTIRSNAGNVEIGDTIDYNDWMRFVNEVGVKEITYDLSEYSIPEDYDFLSRYFKVKDGKVIQMIASPPEEALRLFLWLESLNLAPHLELVEPLPTNFESPTITIRAGVVNLAENVRYNDLQVLLDTVPDIEIILGGYRLLLADVLKNRLAEVNEKPLIISLRERVLKNLGVAELLSRMDTFISSRTAFSMVFPRDFNYELGGKVITDGIIRTGPVVKSDIGGTSTSFQTYILHEYGNDVMGNYLDTIETVTSAYLDIEGMSISMSSCLYSDNRLQQIKDQVIGRMQAEISQLVPPTNEVDRITYEKILSAKLGIMPQIAKKIVELLPRNHTLRAIIDAGTKGKSDIIAQMLSILGQMYIGGKRLQPGMSSNSRCHPGMVPGSTDIVSRGFCKDSLIDGPSPPQYNAHSAASRPNVIDVATGTSNIGTMNRGFYMQLSDVRNRHDGTIRDDNSNIIDFRYGNDNFLRGRYGKDDEDNDGGGLLKMKIGEREVLTFVNIPFEALNLSSYGSNTFKVVSPSFNLTNISKILGYTGLSTGYLGKVEMGKILEYLSKEGIEVTIDQKEQMQLLNDGLAIETISNALASADFMRTKGIEIIEYKQEITYPHVIKSGRDIILYVDPRDVSKAHRVLEGYNYTPI